MCGRFQLVSPAPVLEEHFGVAFAPPPPPRLNIAPTQPVSIVRMNPHVFGRRETVPVLWGLIPPFVRDLESHTLMFNARAEGLHDKPSFRHAIARRRCLVPATAYYEWEHYGGQKLPWAFAIADQECFAMGGIWEIWSGPNGEEIETCAIITIAANELVRPIHARMPLILHPDDYGKWLSHELHFEDELTPYMQAVPPQFMTKTDATEILARAAVPELPTLFDFDELL